MEAIYLGDWSDIEGLKSDYRITDKELQGVEIIVAYYSYENYSGESTVIFKQDGNLYEVEGSHCSCYGLEDQWSPTLISVEYLQHKLREGLINDWNNKREVYTKALEQLGEEVPLLKPKEENKKEAVKVNQIAPADNQGHKILSAIAEVILDKLIKSEPYTLILSEVLDKYKENEGFITDNDLQRIIDNNLEFTKPINILGVADV